MTPHAAVRRRGISPVMATIILVAVTLVIAVPATLLYTSVVDSYASYEDVDVRAVKVTRVENLKEPTHNLFHGTGWNLSITLASTGMSITLKNTATKAVTIKSLLLNGQPVDAYDHIAFYDGQTYRQTGDLSFTITSKQSHQLFIAIKQGKDQRGGIVFNPGVTLEVTLQSTSGLTLSRVVTLT